jgi:uncharacterized protein YecE (DUF72 family)
LENFLLQLPKSNRYVVEMGNKSWLCDEFYDLLKAYNVALAWVDSPLQLPICVMTADFLYIRWEGDRRVVKGTIGKLELNRESNLKLWMQKIKPFLLKGMDVFGYFGKYYSGLPPSDVATLQAHLSEDR